ncbi:glycoside hydrolase superfamily, partial [Apodospora peruviana]
MLKKTLAAVALAAAQVRAADPAVNVYFGQLGGDRLATYCDKPGFEYITLSFVITSPENDPSGLNYAGTNFGAHCAGGYYTNPTTGVSSKLLKNCDLIAADIPVCQAKGKKVLLSIGGDMSIAGVDYTVTGVQKGREFADFMWGAFGPYKSSWTGPRPFDSKVASAPKVSVDGFDLDIEHKFNDEGQAGYVAFVERMRQRYQTVPSRDFLITAAPECPLDNTYFKMKTIIKDAKFDALFIQFYNNYCKASDPVNFNYDAWVRHIQGTASKDAKLYIGLPGSPSGGDGYLEPAAAAALLKKYKGTPSFGGAMFWDAQLASNKT